jgi:hypothetical protein
VLSGPIMPLAFASADTTKHGQGGYRLALGLASPAWKAARARGASTGNLAVWDGHVAMIVVNGMVIEASSGWMSPAQPRPVPVPAAGLWRPEC